MASCPTASTILLGCSSTLQRKEGEGRGRKKRKDKRRKNGRGGEERREGTKWKGVKGREVKRKEKQAETHIMNFLKVSLVPRPLATSLAVQLNILQGTESRVKAREQGYLKIPHFINIP